MERHGFGPHGVQVPRIGQGTWQSEDPDQAVQALRKGIDLGLGHIDTAESYGTEPVVARAIEGRRDEVFLVSKVGPGRATHDGTLKSCAKSLERLKTDHLDLYLLHWPSARPIEGTMSAMAELIDDGKIRMAGVSNFSTEQVEAAREALGGHPLACDQVLYNPAQRDIEADLLPYCQRHEIAVVGYSPFGSGSFPGGEEGKQALRRLGKEHGKTPYQVVLDCLTRQKQVFLIPKMEDPRHVKEAAQALETRLPDEAYQEFDRLFPLPERPLDVPTA